MDFVAQLRAQQLSPGVYLREAKARAKAAGYDASKLRFSTKPAYKLQMTDDEGRAHHFGRAGYGDFLIWSQLERKGRVARGFAAQKQRVFHASHSRMRGAWRSDPYSANALALVINW